MLREDDKRIQIVRVIAVIPNAVENVFDIGVDAPVVLPVSDDDVCLIEGSDSLENNTLVRPVTAEIILPGPDYIAKDFAVPGREVCSQNGKCRVFGCPRNRLTLADIHIACQYLTVSAERLNIRCFGVQPRRAELQTDVVGQRRVHFNFHAGTIDLAYVINDDAQAFTKDCLQVFVVIVESIRRDLCTATEYRAFVTELIGRDGFRTEIARPIGSGITDT